MDFAGLPDRSARRSRLGLLALLTGVAVAYYGGGLLGLQLRFPPATPSVLWPPNAIVTAALLVTPVRQWPWVLAAVLPAHLIAEMSTGWSWPFIGTLYLTNSLEAVLAAGGVCLLSDAPGRLDTLHRLMAFLLAAVVAAPLLSSFADATAVTWFHGEPYWAVWRNRLTANVLAELIVVPAIVGVIKNKPFWTTQTPLRRKLEALALVLGLVITAALTLTPFGSAVLFAIVAQAPLAFELPFVLWSAVRFGGTATSLALAFTTVLTSWSVVHGHGPFLDLQPSVTMLALQLTLILVAVTLLSLSTVIQERGHAERALAERLRFEELLSRLSATFVQLPSDQMEVAFESWLGRLGTALGVDCVRLFQKTDDDDFVVAAAWVTSRCDALAPVSVKGDYPWTYDELVNRQQPVVVHRVDALPAASTDRASLERHGYRAALVIPLIAAGRVIGTIAYGSAIEQRWPEEVIRHLRLVAEVFANALVRKQTEDALRASELMKSAILESLTSGVAVIDRAGRVAAVNENWTRLMQESEGASYPAINVGDNLPESFRAAADQGYPRLMDAVRGVSAVIAGTRDRFIFEHVEPEPHARWWVMLVTRLKRPEGGAVVTYAEISERRRAELDAQRSREQLAHVGRLSTVGALAVSLAHQLNQPLAAIMANAQTAQRLMKRPALDLPELSTILADIVHDDRRAADVILRLREMLKKSATQQADVDLAATVRDVATLVQSDAVIRNVALKLDCDSVRPFVRGDRIQLQQVVLNLIVNALEAISEVPGGARTVHIGCGADQGVARVTVHDSGPGIGNGNEELLFEPFYSTKPGGMGMGLSIARSIVEAHGGCIRLRRGSDTGAVVEFTLPVAHLEHA